MRIVVNIEDKKIANALIGAFEYAIHWADDCEFSDNTPEAIEAARGDWKIAPESMARFYAPLYGGTIRIRERDGQRWYKIDQESLELGLCMLAARYPRHFGDLLSGHDDANTHDLLVQCICFGEERYA